MCTHTHAWATATRPIKARFDNVFVGNHCVGCRGCELCLCLHICVRTLYFVVQTLHCDVRTLYCATQTLHNAARTLCCAAQTLCWEICNCVLQSRHCCSQYKCWRPTKKEPILKSKQRSRSVYKRGESCNSGVAVHGNARVLHQSCTGAAWLRTSMAPHFVVYWYHDHTALTVHNDATGTALLLHWRCSGAVLVPHLRNVYWHFALAPYMIALR